MRNRTILAIAVALVVTACGGGVPEAAPPADTIAVHGDWTIDIYNPDGTLDERIEFENALVPENSLAALLAGDVALEEWVVRLANDEPDEAVSPCDLGIGASCWLFEGTPPVPGPNHFGGLAVTSQSGSLVMAGNAVALNDGAILSVETWMQHPDGGLSPFTKREFRGSGGEVTPIAVAAGQTVQVEVVISFTTG